MQSAIGFRNVLGVKADVRPFAVLDTLSLAAVTEADTRQREISFDLW